MPLFRCDYKQCAQPAVRRHGSCRLCDSHLCVKHLNQKFHLCPNDTIPEQVDAYYENLGPSQRSEMAALLSLISVPALQSRAQSLRGGVTCAVPELVFDGTGNNTMVMGGQNYHIPITFSDGVVWLCRIRQRTAASTPKEHRNKLILNEVATYRFLATKTMVPVPLVHDYSIDCDENPVGVGYILMDKLKGKPLTDFVLSDEQRARVVDQLADIFVELKGRPFTQIGCLIDPHDTTVVGPLLEEKTIDGDEKGKLLLQGPFGSALEYRTSTTKHEIDLVLRGESYIDAPVDAYLIHRFILDDVLPSISEPGPFYLRHMDDKGDHILVDDELRIVGIIDWEWSQITTQVEAFSAPLCLLDIPIYYSGSNELSGMEKEFSAALDARGEEELAGCVDDGRITHRLAHCADQGMEDLLMSFMALLRAVFPHKYSQERWEQWREGAWMRYEKDENLQVLIKKFPLPT